MIWILFRISTYVIVAAAIWLSAQFYIANELWTMLQEKPSHIAFVDQSASHNAYHDNVHKTFFTEPQRLLLQKFSHMSQIYTGTQTFPFATISDAIAFARENNITTIVIYSGSYNEKISIPDGMMLFGYENAEITYDPASKEDVVEMGNNSTLFRINVTGGDNAVVIPYGNNAAIRNLTLSSANDYNVLMGKKERPPTPEGQKQAVTYEILELTEEEILQLPLLLIKNVTAKNSGKQGLYLRDGRVSIENSRIIENGEEGIDLHPHMHVKIVDTEASNNGESGLETEIYDNIITIENSNFDNNIKNGIAFITSLGTGSATVTNSRITNNQQYGLRCAVHKDKPLRPRPFFQTVVTEQNNYYEGNVMKYASDCFHF